MQNSKNIVWYLKISLLVMPLFMTNCVSVKLGNDEIKRAEDVSFKEPSEPFEKFEAPHLDAAWRNNKNGNSISYLSDCNENSDPQLQKVHDGVIKGLNKVKVLENKETMYNRRRALVSTVQGDVDGVPSKLSLVIFSKNSCLYILTYVGLTNTFEQDRQIFDKFVREFKAP